MFKEWSYNGTEKDRSPIARQLARLASMYGAGHEAMHRAIDATALGPWTKPITAADLQSR